MRISWEDGGQTTLRLVLFSAAGACFGVDTRQVAAIGDYTPDATPHEVVILAERFANHTASRSYPPTAILELRCNSRICRVAVDRVEEFIEISGDAILPLPDLVRPYAVKSGIWGVIVRDGRMLLLLDFAELPGLCDLPR